MSNILRKIFINPGSTRNLIFKSDPTINTFAKSYQSNSGWEIIINEDKLSNSTQEFVMSVFAHEIAHYFSQQYLLSIGEPLGEKPYEHSDIFQKWVNSFSSLLRTTFPN